MLYTWPLAHCIPFHLSKRVTWESIAIWRMHRKPYNNNAIKIIFYPHQHITIYIICVQCHKTHTLISPVIIWYICSIYLSSLSSPLRDQSICHKKNESDDRLCRNIFRETRIPSAQIISEISLSHRLTIFEIFWEASKKRNKTKLSDLEAAKSFIELSF